MYVRIACIHCKWSWSVLDKRFLSFEKHLHNLSNTWTKSKTFNRYLIFNAQVGGSRRYKFVSELINDSFLLHFRVWWKNVVRCTCKQNYLKSFKYYLSTVYRFQKLNIEMKSFFVHLVLNNTERVFYEGIQY